MKAPVNKFQVRVMTEEEGGGYLVTFPDLPGCMSDGETVEEAIENASEAESAWLAAHEKWGEGKKPAPAKLVARLPKSVHQDLQQLAKNEGVSINTMLVSLVSRGIGEALGSTDHAG